MKGFIAPEIANENVDINSVDLKCSDMWSFGALMSLAVFRRLPYDLDTDWSKTHQLEEVDGIPTAFTGLRSFHIFKDDWKHHPYFKRARKLIAGLLKIDPKKRLTIEQVVEDELFENVPKNIDFNQTLDFS